MDESEKQLRQKLEILRKNIARKKNKIKKIERSRSAKEHVKKKIQEHKDRTEDDDDLVAQYNLHLSKRALHLTLARTPQVSFNLGKSETASACSSTLDVPKEKAALHRKGRVVAESLVPTFQDEFKADSLKCSQGHKDMASATGNAKARVMRNRQSGRRKASKKQSAAASTQLESHASTMGHSSSCTSDYKDSSIDFIGEQKVAAKIVGSEESDPLLSLGCSESYQKENSKNSLSTLSCSNPDVEKVYVNSHFGMSNDGVVYPGNNVIQCCDDVINEEDLGVLLNPLASKSPICDLDDSMLSLTTGSRKRKQRRSTTELDFTYLDEEGSGDMYSQVKMRRRRNKPNLCGVPFEESKVSDTENSQIILAPLSSISQEMLEAAEVEHTDSATSDQSQRDSLASSELHDVMRKEHLYSNPNSGAVCLHYSSISTASSCHISSPTIKPLLTLPPKEILRKVEHFNLPESDYAELKILKVQLQDAGAEPAREALVQQDVIDRCSSPSQHQEEASHVLLGLPSKDVVNKFCHSVQPNTDDDLLKLSEIKMETMRVRLAETTHLSLSPSLVRDSKACRTNEPEPATAERCASVPYRKVNRRSHKLSPILKVAADIRLFSALQSSDDTSLTGFAKSPMNSQLNNAMIAEPLDIADEEGLRCELSQNNNAISENQQVYSTSANNPLHMSCDSVDHANPERPMGKHVRWTSAEEADIDSKEEYLVKTIKLKGNLKTVSVGLHEIDQVQFGWPDDDPVRCVDAACGHLVTEPAVLAALSSSHCLQLWAQKKEQPWVLLHSWQMQASEFIQDVQVVGTGDVTTIMVTLNTSLMVAGYGPSGSPWTSVVHKNNSSGNLLSCKAGDCILVAEVSDCGSDIIMYTLCEDGYRCHPAVSVGSAKEPLVSLNTLASHQGAVVGFSQSTVFIWNLDRAVLVAEIVLPLVIGHCLSVAGEHGFLFLWVTVSGGLPCLLAINPSTRRCVVVNTAQQPQEASIKRLGGACVGGAWVAGLSATTRHLSVWDLSGRHRACLGLPGRPTCVSQVRQACGDRFLVTTQGRLQQFSIVVV